MGVVVTNRAYDLPDYASTGTTPYLPGAVGDRVKCVIDFYVQWKIEEYRMEFDTSDDSITLINDFQADNFVEQGFVVGDEIEVTGTASNDGTYTIDSFSDDGRTIYTVENLVDETAESANVYGTTAITALDFFYNCIENSAQESYYSLTDTKAVQRYIASGIDASDTLSAVNMRVGSESFAWVTHEILDTDTGETDQVYIIGQGISADFKQQFRITQYFLITPLWLAEQRTNFTNDEPPSYFQPGHALKHIVKMDAKFLATDPYVYHTGNAIDVNGFTSWFNRNPVESRPEYYLDSISYVDDITTDAVDRPDIGRKTNVTAVIKSRTGLFENTTTILLGANLCSTDESDFTETDTTLLQNMYHDRFAGTLASAGQNGDQFGTDYQHITNITCVRDSATQATISFSIELATAGTEYLADKGSENRAGHYWIAIKGPSIVTTKDAVHMALDLAFTDFDYNQDDDTLFEWVGAAGVATFEYPDGDGEIPIGDHTGWSGDPIFSRVGPFRVNTAAASGISPTIKTVKMQVLAVKTGEDDFVLEEKIIDCSTVRKLKATVGGAIGYPQTIDVDEERGFTTYDDDPFNRVRLQRDPDNDFQAMRAYTLEYGFVFRYEYWIAVFPTKGIVNNNTDDEPVVNSITDVTQQWSNFNGVDSWSLQLKFTITIEGYDGAETEFYAFKTLTVKAPSGEADEAPILGGTTQFFDEDETEEINMIVKEGTTLIRTTYTAVATSDFTIVGTSGAVNWSINGDVVDDVAFNSADVPGTEALFQLMLDEFYPGFTIELTRPAGTWLGTVTSTAPGLTYEGEVPAIVTLVGASGSSAFVLDAIALPVDTIGYYGWMFSDVPGTGSIFARRFASTEIASEDDSPWSPTADPGDALDSYADGNLRFNLYADRIEVEGYFDSTIYGRTANILIYKRLGYQYPPT